MIAIARTISSCNDEPLVLIVDVGMVVLDDVIAAAGGVPACAAALGVTPRAIYKWLARGSLPRTEYTGETDYAAKLAPITQGRFSVMEIHSIGSPRQKVA